MNLLQKKLNSKRGASMILVLSLFLICVMVSAVIITAASSGVSRNAQRVEQQNGYLAISSASDLIIGELETLGVYAGQNISGKYGCQDCTVAGYINYNSTQISGYRLDAEYTSNPLNKDYVSNPLDDGHLLIKINHDPYVFAVKDGDNTTLDGVFAGAFERGCTQVFTLGVPYTETMKIALVEEDDRLPDVTCKFTMDENYDVKFLLTTENSDYAISISCISDVKISDITETVVTTDEHTIYYKRFDESTGSYYSVREEWKIPIEVTTTTTEISWGGPMIEKEVLSQ